MRSNEPGDEPTALPIAEPLSNLSTVDINEAVAAEHDQVPPNVQRDDDAIARVQSEVPAQQLGKI